MAFDSALAPHSRHLGLGWDFQTFPVLHAQNAGPQGPACAKPATETLTPRNHLLRSAAIHVGLIEYDVVSHMCWPGGQHLLLAVNQIARIKRRELKSMPVRNRIGRASLHAISAKNAPVVIDVVGFGVAFRTAHAMFGGIVGGLDVDAIRGTVGRAQEAGYAFFQSIFVALEDMSAAKAGFDASAAQRTFPVGIIFNRRRLEHLHEGDAHALGDGGYVFQNRHCS
jgi:hypothetical protein